LNLLRHPNISSLLDVVVHSKDNNTNSCNKIDSDNNNNDDEEKNLRVGLVMTLGESDLETWIQNIEYNLNDIKRVIFSYIYTYTYYYHYYYYYYR